MKRKYPTSKKNGFSAGGPSCKGSLTGQANGRLFAEMLAEAEAVQDQVVLSRKGKQSGLGDNFQCSMAMLFRPDFP